MISSTILTFIYIHIHINQLARELLSWSKPFETVTSGSFAEGDVAWFLEGELNVAFNCVDRHALATPDKVIIKEKRE
jgi:hypothetical protein